MDDVDSTFPRFPRLLSSWLLAQRAIPELASRCKFDLANRHLKIKDKGQSKALHCGYTKKVPIAQDSQ